MSWSILGVLLLAGIALWLLNLLRDIFPPMALALIIIVLLNPMVSGLEKRGIPRWLGTAAIYLMVILGITLAVSYLAPPLGRQINDLIRRGPEIRHDATEVAEDLASKVGLSLADVGLTNPGADREPSASGEQPRRSAPGEGTPSFIQTLGGRLFAGAGRFATGALHVVVNFILAPVLALYLLIDLPKIQRAFTHYLPPRYRDEWLPLLDRAGQAVGAFFRGQLLVAAIVGVLSSISFLIIDLPFWLPLGLLVGFFNIIPLVGPFVGGSIAVLVGGVTGGLGLAVKAGLAMLAVQQLDNHFISPKVMGRAVRLHPVAVMLALLAGATLGGIWGMLLFVPGLAVAKVLAVYFYETRVLGNRDYRPTIPGAGSTAKAAAEKPLTAARGAEKPAPAAGAAAEPPPAARAAAEPPAPTKLTEQPLGSAPAAGNPDSSSSDIQLEAPCPPSHIEPAKREDELLEEGPPPSHV